MLCLNVHQVMFDYSSLEAHISKSKNDRNKQISDLESRFLESSKQLRSGSICTNIMQWCAEVVIYLRTTLRKYIRTHFLLNCIVSYRVSHILCSCVTIDTFLGFHQMRFSICHVLFDQSVNSLSPANWPNWCTGF